MFRFLPLILMVLCPSLVLGAAKPNIIFILTDEQGFGDLGCFGARNIATPNIDRLCTEGMKFTSFYVTNRCSPIHFLTARE